MEDHIENGGDARKPAAARTRLLGGENDGGDPTEEDDVVIPVQGELPFLVTHWLAGFKSDSPSQTAAVEKIRRAACELASAFHTLGVFGEKVSTVQEGTDRMNCRTRSHWDCYFSIPVADGWSVR